MTDQPAPAVVHKSVIVNRNIAHVFSVWTEQINAWWPAGHSMSRNPNTRVHLERQMGGRFYERTPEGEEYNWGRVEEWEPPHGLTLSWYMGSGQEQPSQVRIEFEALDTQTTRVDVLHRGPELIGELWESRQTIFSGSWERILSAVASFCA